MPWRYSLSRWLAPRVLTKGWDRCVAVVSAEADERQDREHDDDEADQVDDAVHGFPPHEWLMMLAERPVDAFVPDIGKS
jgi:hypothetical protein